MCARMFQFCRRQRCGKGGEVVPVRGIDEMAAKIEDAYGGWIQSVYIDDEKYTGNLADPALRGDVHKVHGIGLNNFAVHVGYCNFYEE